MAKELLIYGSIDSESSTTFINKLEEYADQDVSVRVNTPGGSPEYGWGMLAKFAEHRGKKLVKGDGKAHSMGLYWFCYAEDTECLDVTEFLLHRAAYPQWFESTPEYFTAEIKGNLERVNASLRTAFERKVDVEKFENLPNVKSKGIKVKDIFSMDSRIDVFLSARDAKKIGLVDRINPITPAKKAEIDSLMVEITAKYTGTQTEIKTEQPKNKIMTIEQLKAEHPAVYKQAFEAGVTAEKDRVGAFMVYNEIDPKAVKEGILKGEALTQTQMAEFGLKAMSKAALGKIEDAAAPAVVTAAEENKEVKPEAKALNDFEKTVRAQVGLK